MSWRKGRQPDRNQWRRARRAILTAQNWTCQVCGGLGNEVDHIVPIDRMAADADLCGLDGLQCLCRGCHISKTRAENTIDAVPGRDAWRELVERMAESVV